MNGRSILVTTTILLAVLLTCVVAPLAAASGPTKFTLSFQVGGSIDKTKSEEGKPQEERNECTVASKDVCQLGVEGSGPRQFLYSESLAVSALTGNVYVADKVNHRVQELDQEGAFVLMFGFKVNKTTGGDVCTEQEIKSSGVKCGEGENGTGLPGQIFGGQDVAVDPGTGNVYVLELQYRRVEEFTANGEFVLMIGGGVNKTTGGNICSKAEIEADGVECQAGVEGTGHGAFEHVEFTGYGNLITVGPEDHLLYVGDEARVQKFEADGKWNGQISVAGLSPTGHVLGVAVDNTGDLFLTDGAVPGVHEYNQSGELQSCVIDPSSTNIHALGLDQHERLAAIDWTGSFHGTLYETQGGACGTQVGGAIAPPSGGMGVRPHAVAFSFYKPTSDRLYVAKTNGTNNEIEGYIPIRFPEVVTCAAEGLAPTSAILCGEVNPEGLPTMGFFDYGKTAALGSQTPTVFGPSESEAFEPAHYLLTGLVPNEFYYEEMLVEAEVEEVGGVKKTENAGGEPPLRFHTTTPPPALGQPEAMLVDTQSAALSGSLNPEHAATRYYFEYAACQHDGQTLAECGVALKTPILESSQYGFLPDVQEVAGLAPATPYVFRLVADNSFTYEGNTEGGPTAGDEGHFTTASLPVLHATTGGHSSVTATQALVAGVVDAGGQPATYAFELGIYAGASTRYGVVFSGSVEATAGPVSETLGLSGLQPGVQYAYRILVKSGYGEAIGSAETFTTDGLPAVLSPPAEPKIVPAPSVAFPKVPLVVPRALTTAQRLARALRACAKRPKNRRAACRRSARKKYAIAKSKRN